MDSLELLAAGVNLTCYGAIIPRQTIFSQLAEWANRIESKFGITLQMVSGGNSSSIYLIEKGASGED